MEAPETAPATSKTQGRYWCLTINNYSEKDWPWNAEEADALFTYAIVGREKAPTTGTEHMQCYVVFKKTLRFTQVKKHFPNAHISQARGTPQQNYAYCSKEGDFQEIGTLPAGKGDAGGDANRKRYVDALDAAKEGRLDDIPADLYTKHYATYKKIKTDHMVALPDAGRCTGVWIYGETGAGKSRYARETYPDYYLKACNKWWDGYQDHDNVIIEDIDPLHECLGHHIKLWTDRHDFPGETKGGTIRIRPQNVVLTSQYTIEQVFSKDPLFADAIRRRCKVIHMTPKGPIVDAFARQDPPDTDSSCEVVTGNDYE